METPDTFTSKRAGGAAEGPLDAGPCGSRTPKPMSASLRERLKRSRRSFKAPSSVAKRLKVEADEENLTDSATLKETANPSTSVFDGDEQTDLNRNQTVTGTPASKGSETAQVSVGSCEPSQTDLLQLREELSKEVREKTETLRRLKMAKMYRRKNDLTQLEELIQKWRHCCQSVLYELQELLPVGGEKASLSQLIDHLGLEDRLLHFDRTEEDFTDS